MKVLKNRHVITRVGAIPLAAWISGNLSQEIDFADSDGQHRRLGYLGKSH